MWTDIDGVLHTAAVPDWRDVFGLSANQDRALRTLPASALQSLSESLEKAEEDFYEEMEGREVDPVLEERFYRAQPPKLTILVESQRGTAFVRALVNEILEADARWRLDYIEAMLDVVDELSA